MFIVDILVNLIGLIVMPSGCSVPGCKRRGGGMGSQEKLNAVKHGFR